MQRRTSETFEQVVNASLVQTMARSLNTSLTVLFTLSALTLFGGTTIRTFTLTLLIGIFSGTYSSIFNASMLLVIWERGELGFGRLGGGRTQGGSGRREARELARSGVYKQIIPPTRPCGRFGEIILIEHRYANRTRSHHHWCE
jgi:hypothetical protein